MFILIDNYDSFTYNLWHFLGSLGVEVVVHRNDQISTDEVMALNPQGIVLSPGPRDPDSAGICLELIERAAGKVPVFGVCLGLQSIGQAFGGKIVHAGEIMHGKTSMVYHSNVGVFAGLANPFVATRYHSLVIEQASIPDCLEVTAWTQQADGSRDEIMGVRHTEFNIEGVQYHPESILSQHGHDQLANFLKMQGGMRA